MRKVIGRDHAGITVNGIDDVLVRYAQCCNPLPGDAIIGFITRGRGVTVHRRECKKAFDTDPERRVDVTWDSKAKINRPVQLCVTTANKPGILATVSQTFSARASTSAKRTAAPATTASAQRLHVPLCRPHAAQGRDARPLARERGRGRFAHLIVGRWARSGGYG